MRLRMKVVDLALGDRQTCIHIDAIRLHAPRRIGSAVPNKNLQILTIRRLEYERSKFAVIETLIAFHHCRNFSDLHWRLFFRIGLQLKNIDRVPDTRTIPVPNKNTVAGDAETARIALAIKISALPFTGTGVFHRWNSDDPVQMLEVAKEM